MDERTEELGPSGRGWMIEGDSVGRWALLLRGS